MRSIRKHSRFIAGVAGVLLFAVLLFSVSDAVHKCEIEEKKWSAEHRPHSRPSYAMRLYRRVYVSVACSAGADDVWVALSGIAVAAFTFTLWRSTERLWQSAEHERRFNAKQSELAREEFVLVHRPKLKVRNVVCASDELGPVNGGQLIISNYGDTEAIVIGSHVMVDCRNGPMPTRRPYDGQIGNNFVSGIIGAGQPYTALFGSGNVVEVDDFFQHLHNEAHVAVLGFVDYRDRIGTRRRTAFCRVWDNRKRTFVKSDDENYEHEE